jgi:hypothetical protein
MEAILGEVFIDSFDDYDDFINATNDEYILEPIPESDDIHQIANHLQKHIWFTKCLTRHVTEECNKVTRAIYTNFLTKVLQVNPNIVLEDTSEIHTLIENSKKRSKYFNNLVINNHEGQAFDKNTLSMIGLANQMARQITIDTVGEYHTVIKTETIVSKK